jgi:hypothetical protein
MLPSYHHTMQPATFTLEHQGNRCPCVSRTHGSHCSTSNRRHKPAGLVLLSWQQHHWTVLLEAHTNNQALLPSGLVSPASSSCVAPDSLHQQVGPRAIATQRLGSLMPAAVAVAPDSPVPASRPQGSCCLQTWVLHACSSCHCCWNPTPQCK